MFVPGSTDAAKLRGFLLGSSCSLDVASWFDQSKPEVRMCVSLAGNSRPPQRNCTTKLTKDVKPTQLLTIGWFDVIVTKTEL